MRIVLVLAILGLPFLSQAQSSLQEASDLVILKFSCGKSEEPSRVIRSVQEPDPPMNEPFTIRQTPKNEPQEIKNRRDMQERRDDMRTAEANAKIPNQPIAHSYFYHLQFKNV